MYILEREAVTKLRKNRAKTVANIRGGNLAKCFVFGE